MNWNEVAEAGLLNPVPPVGKGMGFVPMKDVKRLPKEADGFTGLDYQLTKLNLSGRFYWWKLTGEGDIVQPAVHWCGRGRDIRPWPKRLRARWAKTKLATWLDFRFGPLRWTRERPEDQPARP